MPVVYSFFLFFYYLGIRIAALSGNQKARQWVAGRKNVFAQIESFIKNLKPQTLPANAKGEQQRQAGSNLKLIWFHCSSLGEFEQGRPVIEKLKIKNEKCRIVLTFFSPSGYEVRKNYAGADLVCYLPADSKKNAKRFIEHINPSAAYFVKYEYWYYYFRTLKEKNIPLYLVSAIFRDDQVFFRWYGKFFRNVLKCVTHFFVQDENSLKRLNTLGFTNATVTGDTRFDRVAEIAVNPKGFPLVEKFCAGHNVIVAGSTWPKDEKILLNLKPQTLPANAKGQQQRQAGSNLKLIIAPHDISESRIKEVENLFAATHKVIRHSQADEQSVFNSNVLVIDSIGMLSSLYRYAWITYVGGGFGSGIHNILEAAVYGKPVFFGPRFHKAAEAGKLIEKGGAFSIEDSKQMMNTLERFMNDEPYYSACCETSRRFVSENTGATEKILKKTSEYFLRR